MQRHHLPSLSHLFLPTNYPPKAPPPLLHTRAPCFGVAHAKQGPVSCGNITSTAPPALTVNVSGHLFSCAQHSCVFFPSPPSSPKTSTTFANSFLLNYLAPHHHQTRPTPTPPTTCHESFWGGRTKKRLFWIFDYFFYSLQQKSSIHRLLSMIKHLKKA